MPHAQRILKLQKLVEEFGCEAFLTDNKTDLYYLTGLDMSAGALVVSGKGANLYVDSRYYETCKARSPTDVHLLEAVTEENILMQPQFQHVKTLGFDSAHTTYHAFQLLTKACNTLMIELLPLEDPVAQLRLIKDAAEILRLKEAADLGSAGYDYVVALLREGLTEIEVALELEIFWKLKGGKSLAFDPIIAFGPNSSMPHYRPGKIALQRGNVVLIDIGVNLDYYHSDMTRTIFFGDPDPRLVTIYHIVKDAQQAALDICRPGTRIGDLDKAARQHITSQGFGSFFTHGLGHGVGLEIHEAPWVRSRPPHNELPLQEGMVITIEPGIYLPGIGGVRIEDTVAISGKGHINLTNRPKDLIFI